MSDRDDVDTFDGDLTLSVMLPTVRWPLPGCWPLSCSACEGLPGKPVGPSGVRAGGHPDLAPVACAQNLQHRRLNEATDGWTSGWTEGASPVSTKVNCDDWVGEYPGPLGTSTTEFPAGTRVGATLKVERFDTAELASDSMHRQTWDEDWPGEWVELPDEIWIGGQSVCYGGRLDGQPFYEAGSYARGKSRCSAWPARPTCPRTCISRSSLPRSPTSAPDERCDWLA